MTSPVLRVSPVGLRELALRFGMAGQSSSKLGINR